MAQSHLFCWRFCSKAAQKHLNSGSAFSCLLCNYGNIANCLRERCWIINLTLSIYVK